MLFISCSISRVSSINSFLAETFPIHLLLWASSISWNISFGYKVEITWRQYFSSGSSFSCKSGIRSAISGTSFSFGYIAFTVNSLYLGHLMVYSWWSRNHKIIICIYHTYLFLSPQYVFHKSYRATARWW